MKYLTYNNNYWGLDIEADSLTPTVIHCVCVRNIGTNEELTFTSKDTFLSWLRDEFCLVGHNILSFDLPWLSRLWGLPDVWFSRCVDTLVLSYLYHPALDGGHSLDEYGRRLKFPKVEFSDFSKFTQQMEEYCRQDVRLCLRVYKALVTRMTKLGYSELSCDIEHKIRHVINEQQDNGFWFDEKRARDFLVHLRGIQSDLTTKIQKLFPPDRVLVKGGRRLRNKKGGFTSQFDKDAARYEVVIDESGETYSVYQQVEFNIGSPQQRVERLTRLGWEPDKFTKKGFPQVDEDSLVRFAEVSGRPEVASMAEWLVLQGRSSMIETWLQNLGSDSRIHGKILTCGATTRRMTHSNPNTANIPSGAKAKYGHECRSCWGVQPGSGLVLVGYDAAGLETAGLCHYLNNPKATEILLRPKPDDIHTSNARRLTEALGRPIDREWGAKTSWYAWLYGAYPPKLGTIVKGPPSDGEIVIETFFRNVPGLKRLIDGIQYEWKSSSGRLETIDSGYVVCPNISAALNYKIQSAGAIVMKMTSILLREEAAKIGLWFRKVGDIHDEGQLEVRAEDASHLGNLAVDCIRNAGRLLKFNVALDGDFKVGNSWAETH